MANLFRWSVRFGSLALALVLAAPTWAQLQTGSVFGRTLDDKGQPLPGVTVTLSGVGAPMVQTSDAQGGFRFLGLSPGDYSVRAELEGFSPVEYPRVNVRVGLNTQIELRLQSAVTDVISVTAESPLLDQRRISAGATVTQLELEKIPTARDPWAVLQSVPGVLVDRINVGGSETGEQSNFVSAGAGRTSANWAIDGVMITDPAAIGASPSYYDFDSFEEMQFSTAGTDISAMTGGVQINLVTKRGTNEFRGSARYLVTDDNWQSDPNVKSGDLGKAGPWNRNNAQPAFSRSNKIAKVEDYGGEVGGPILKDRVWIWASYAKNDVEKYALGLNNTLIPDNTFLKTWVGKVNAQITQSTSFQGFYHEGDKIKFGRNAGPTRPKETTWNQTGPSPIWKAELTQLFGSNLFLTALYSEVEGGFQLVPQSGLNAPDMVTDAGGVSRNSFYKYETLRPQELAKLDGSYFFNTGSINHELKFGVSYRYNEVFSRTSFPGRGLWGRKELGNFCTAADPCALGLIVTDWIRNDSFTQKTAYAQDVLAADRWTLNVGLRYDLQEPTNLSFTQPASKYDPALIPAVTRPERKPGFEWETIVPRVGLTYALGEEQKTLLRASYSQFVNHMSTGVFSSIGPSMYRTGYFFWRDRNNDNQIQDSEIERWFVTAPVDVNRIANSVDKNLKPELTQEVLLGVEHALLPEFVVSAQLIYRNESDIRVSYTKVVEGGVTRPHQKGDYTLTDNLTGTLPNGRTFSVPVYRLRSGVTRDPLRGFHIDNSDIEIETRGVSLGFTKRLSNRWMARGHFTWGRSEYDIPDSELIDPTPTVSNRDGGVVMIASAGSGNRGEVWMTSDWSYNLSAMYQIAPDRIWGFNIAADLNGREGFPVPYRANVAATSALGITGITRQVLVSPEADSFRNDDIHILNLRAEKEFNFDRVGVTVSVDCFNVTNNNSVLQREGLISANRQSTGAAFVNFTRSDHVRETVVPRVFRIGARISFN